MKDFNFIKCNNAKSIYVIFLIVELEKVPILSAFKMRLTTKFLIPF